MNYTKGKWIKQGLFVGTVSEPNVMGDIVAICTYVNSMNETADNAQLIAASPDMYKSIKLMTVALTEQGLQGTSPEIVEAYTELKRALAKADGK